MYNFVYKSGMYVLYCQFFGKMLFYKAIQFNFNLILMNVICHFYKKMCTYKKKDGFDTRLKFKNICSTFCKIKILYSA